MYLRIFFIAVCFFISLSHGQIQFMAEASSDHVKLVWYPEQWGVNQVGFNIKKRVKKGAWMTITIPEKVIKHRHLGKFIIQGKDLVPLKLYYILEN